MSDDDLRDEFRDGLRTLYNKIESDHVELRKWSLETDKKIDKLFNDLATLCLIGFALVIYKLWY